MRYIGRSTLIKFLTAVAISSTALSANAEVLNCVATVKAVTVHPWGNVYVEFNGLGTTGPTPFCNVNGTYATGDTAPGAITSIYPEVCNSWLGMFLTAKSTGQSITMAFSYPGTAPTCSALSFAWTPPIPYPYWMSLTN